MSLPVEAMEEDKAKHLILSFTLGAITHYTTEDWKTSIGACITVGLVKELYDEYDYGGFDNKDLAYDAVGCALGAVVGDTALKLYRDDDAIGLQYTLNF
jgi:hypothetical protein